MATNNSPFIDFFHWVDKHKVKGIDGSGNPAHYVPYAELERYWQPDRIAIVLRSFNYNRPINVVINEVIRRFLRIFSILVYISRPGAPKVSYIQQFCRLDLDDYNLPFMTKPPAFSEAPDGEETFKDFLEYQFRFWPVPLDPKMHMKRLPTQCVLPITLERTLSGRKSDTAVIKKCVLQPSSNLTVPGDTIVMKEYRETELDFSFSNEVEAYTVLENQGEMEKASKYFLRYYGSFIQNGKGFILLEYADQGSLLDFFRKNHLPHERGELHRLWKSLSSNLLRGLEMLHSLNERVTEDVLRGIHQDLKPANIFVFSGEDGTPYSYRFKIGDFGLSSISLVKAKGKEMAGPDNKSTKMYGAPELTNYYQDLAHLDKGVTWEVDIWSLGCVLFEVAVWATCGERGREEFLEKRERDTAKVPHHHAQGYGGSFHDGEKRIGAVDEMFVTIVERRRVFDDLTEPLAHIVLEEMLLPKDKKRLNASQLLTRFLRKLDIPPSASHKQKPSLEPLEISPQSRENGAQPSETDPRFVSSPQSAGVRSPDGYNSPGPVFDGDPGPAGLRFGQTWHRHEMDSSDWSRDDVLGAQGAGNQKFMPSNLTSTLPLPHDQRPSHVSALPIQLNGAADLPYRPHSDSDSNRSELPTTDSQVTRYLNHAPPGPVYPPTPQPGLLQQNPVQYGSPRPENALPVPAQSSRSGNPTPEDTGQATTVPPRESRRAQTATTREYPMTSVDQVITWITKKKKNDKRNIHTDPMPGQVEALHQLKNREQIFVIDDSTSMRTHHWNDVIQTFKALAYLVKSADPNGIELFLTSMPQRGQKARKDTTKKLIRFLKGCANQSALGNCNMEDSLGQILERVKRNLSSRVSVYIFTDAVWEPSEEIVCGVDVPIRSLVKEMERRNLPRTYVSLQFIRFSDDEIGRNRLRYLDDDLGKELDFDIVDQRYYRGNVWLMLIGSISKQIDKVKDVDDSKGHNDTREGDKGAG